MILNNYFLKANLFFVSLLAVCVISCKSQNGKGYNHFTIVSSKDKVTLDVNFDSINNNQLMLTAIFTNRYVKPLWLYKNYLPIPRMKYNIFSIYQVNTESNSNEIKAKGLEDIPMRNGDVYPFTPKIIADNFIILNPGDSLVFNLNLSDYYQFPIKNAAKVNQYYLTYAPLMPFVYDSIHIKEVNKDIAGESQIFFSYYYIERFAQPKKEYKPAYFRFYFNY